MLDTIPQFEPPKQEIIITLDDVINAKNIFLGKDIKITDDALAFALINKIPIHKDALKHINTKDVIETFKTRQKEAEKVKQIENKLGITLIELKKILK